MARLSPRGAERGAQRASEPPCAVRGAAPGPRVRAHRPRVAADGAVRLPQVGLEVAAVLAAGVARAAVDPAAVPTQPVAGFGVDVLAEAQVEHLPPERRVGLRVGAAAADLADEGRDGHA